MARIRTIKPEFWVSEQVGECTPLARLLFIGMWNFCDDQGVHPAKFRTLKAQIFPFDSTTADDVGALVAELVKVGLVREFEVNGEAFLHVTGWNRHQRIEKPSRKYPLPVGKDSPTIPGMLGDRRPPEGKGKEGRGGERSTTCEQAAPASLEIPPVSKVVNFPDCPHDELIALYHACMPGNPKVRSSRWPGSASETNLRARWREGLASDDSFFRYSTREEGLAVWRKFFETCAMSDFLSGRSAPNGGRDKAFVADLHWLVVRKNFDKVLANRYHNNVGAPRAESDLLAVGAA